MFTIIYFQYYVPYSCSMMCNFLEKSVKYVRLGKTWEYTGFLWYKFLCIYPWVVPYIVKCGLEPLYLHIICSVQLSLLVNFCTTFFSNALAKFCAWNAKLATLTSCSAFFFLLPQVTMYISSSVTMHLLGSITESTEFQSNSTGFKLFSSTDIRFEQIKRK